MHHDVPRSRARCLPHPVAGVREEAQQDREKLVEIRLEEDLEVAAQRCNRQERPLLGAHP
eukprot:scaffold3307_cov265-Pinguiococcus_pyrenoidosus.AAC.16